MMSDAESVYDVSDPIVIVSVGQRDSLPYIAP